MTTGHDFQKMIEPNDSGTVIGDIESLRAELRATRLMAADIIGRLDKLSTAVHNFETWIRRLRERWDELQAENQMLHLTLFQVENGLGHEDPQVRKLIEAAGIVRRKDGEQ